MKNFKNILLTCLIFASSLTDAQIARYHVIRVSHNHYDKDMQSYNGWSEWSNTIEEYASSSAEITLSLSANAARLVSNGITTEGVKSGTILYSFVGDEPTTQFPFRKKVSIKTNINTNGSNSVKNTGEVAGMGIIYSSASFESIIAGNSTADVYVYFEMSDGDKGYIGFAINKFTKAELEQRKAIKEQEEEEARENEEAARIEKQKKLNQRIKSISNSMQTLLKK
jgi:hypothetical protein